MIIHEASVVCPPILIRNWGEKILPKSFKEEVRPATDVNNFIADVNIVLDLNETDLRKILEISISKLVAKNIDLSLCQPLICLSDDVYQLKDTIRGMRYTSDGYVYEETWLVIMANLPFIDRRITGIVRLLNSTNFGNYGHDVKFVIFVFTPINEEVDDKKFAPIIKSTYKLVVLSLFAGFFSSLFLSLSTNAIDYFNQKITKNAFETGRTFATLFMKPQFRHNLTQAKDVTEFVEIIEKRKDELIHLDFDYGFDGNKELIITRKGFRFCSGIRENISRRLKYYKSDFVDGLKGKNTLRKTLATIFFLYFACILPCIAFGVLVDKTTNGLIDARRAIIGQAIGGLFFALFSGQPLVIIATTAPLCLFTKVVYEIAQDFNVDFYSMFACVGLWNSFFVLIYSLFDVSLLMRWCTRSTEEIFSIFIFFAFTLDSLKDVITNFKSYYPGYGCVDLIAALNTSHMGTISWPQSSNYLENLDEKITCKPEACILFILLMLSTLWLALKLFNFNQKPFLGSVCRDLISDYALPIAVIVFSLLGSFAFSAIEIERFTFRDGFSFTIASLDGLPPQAIAIAAGLGFTLSLLFFMDQNISAALVNTPYNNLKKGSGYHLDLLIVSILNAITALLGLPWMHGILPHSPLHARAMADVETRVEDGCIKQVVVAVRETRITGICAHILIALSLYLIPYPLSYIPVPVLDGLFLYCAFASLRGNSLYERFLLFFTEQNAYPPNHYVRRCPQKTIHLFTFTQIVQLAIICAFGFWNYPYVQMAFPVVIALLIPIRYLIIPFIIPKKFLMALDGYH